MTQPVVTQNIYDTDDFFEAYSRLPRSREGLAGAPEWPSLRALLPDLRGSNVLDLGCGFGWFCRWARENGAASVVGLDVSEKMLSQARAATPDDAITYIKTDLEHAELGENAFDLVYSSLALHYIVDLDSLLARVRRALRRGGDFVFSVEHPMLTAPSNPMWSHDEAGLRTWPIHRYLDEGPRVTDWLAKGVTKQHRTLATYVNLLRKCGFTLTQLEEWGPTPEQIASAPALAEERERPSFLLVAAHG